MKSKVLVHIALLIGALIFGTAGMTAAYEFHPHGWTVPNIYGANRFADDMFDFDPAVPGAETRLEKFMLPSGVRVYRYSHNGNVFAWVVDLDGYDPPDYELVDMDGSGGFEIKQSPYNEFPLPRWTFKPYEYPQSGGGMVRKTWTGGRPTADRIARDLYGKGGDDAKNRRITLNVLFELDSDRLTPEARSLLNDLGLAMSSDKLKDYQFLIEGHTDASGSLDYNQDLSEKRARAVENYLVKEYGIDPGRMKIVGKGEIEPLPGTAPEDGVNRRVEIVNLGLILKDETPQNKQAAVTEKFE